MTTLTEPESDKPRLRIDRSMIVAGHDLAMAALSFVLALYLRLGEDFWIQTRGFLWLGLGVFVLAAGVVFSGTRLYRGVWRYASIDDLIAIARAATIAVLVFLVAMFFLTRLDALPRSALVINWLLLMALLGGPRLAYRLIKGDGLAGLASRGYDQRVPVLMIGAGDAAELFLREMRRPAQAYRVVGLLDDDPNKRNRQIHGVRVLGPLSALPRALDKLKRRGRSPQRLLVADETLGGGRLSKLIEAADGYGLTVARLPRLTDFANGDPARVDPRPIALEDLLRRPQTRLDRDAMAALVGGRRVLVTGAGGTIGGELVRQIAALAPAHLTLLDNGEFNLYQIEREAAERWPELSRNAVLADIRDAKALARLFADESPTLVFHAAALKHVPIAEENPCEAVLTNVIGTRHVADACRRAGVRAMVLISTDKAVNPSSVMGATKRLAEIYCQTLDRAPGGAGERARYVTVRFGNVLGSTGSVVPLFQRQIAVGGPLTVTHPEITRYFMTTREAVELVLQASAMALSEDGGGDAGRIHVLDMGEPIRIQDLARQMIRLAGLRPDQDIQIAYSGLRPGEKLHEQLFHAGEGLLPTSHDGIRLASPRAADAASLARRLDDLFEAASQRQDEAALGLLRELVSDYRFEGRRAAGAR